jgi:3'-phosphoadenosine 5'-phosphosulfate sulfotransferase (PAPS reductase)/FAD synthetase
MSNPFQIDGPAVISFSGGRTSGYMLRRILDEGLRPDVHVLFADTGKERRETYRFVVEVAQKWDVEIHAVYRPGYFTKLITDKQMLPNPVMRFCTSELKMRPIQDWMKAQGYTYWTNVVGIRSDEPRRVVRLREREDACSDVALPLADASVTLADVTAFWQAQPFDLQLQTGEGNCDLCFLKGFKLRQQIARDHPELAEWWIDQERERGATFRNDGRRYLHLLTQPDLFVHGQDEDTLTECFCHD